MTPPAGVVALLFTDLVRSTEMLGRLGDDAADELRRRHFALLREEVAVAGGEEVKSLGDGLMVSFTSPVAALSCAVAMQRAVSHSGLELRVGIHAGEPIRDESDLFGGAVVVARRLCDAAWSGQILTSQLIADLVGRRGSFRFRALGPLALKGLPEPVRTVALEWSEPAPPRWVGASAAASTAGAATGSPADGPAPGRARRPRGPRLIGRDRELEVLEGELSATSLGEFHCVLLTADAGVGKTRLAAELAARHANDTVVLSARGHPFGETAAFALWTEAFEGHLRSLESHAISRLCGGLLDDLAGLLRSVAAVRGSVPDRPVPRTNLLEGLAVLIHNLARARPVLVLLDDVHQADASSWETLDYLARGLESAPVLVVLGARPAELAGQQVASRVLFGLEQDGFLRRLPLSPLAGGGIAELAEEVLRSRVPPALASWLAERSGGNPLFALGLLRALIDENADLDHPQLRRLPEDLAERVQGMLATFDEPALATIEMLSVLGRRATMTELAAFSDRHPEQLSAVVDRLVRSRALGEEEGAGEVRIGFLHPLIQETVYQSLGATRRRALHRLIGRALTATGRSGEAAAHFARSATPGDDEAIAALLVAVRQAEERGAFRESLTLLTSLVDVLPSGDSRWLDAAEALAWQADWINDRGRGDKLAVGAIRAMREIDAALETNPDDSRRAPVKSRLANCLMFAAGEVDEGIRLAEEAERLYQAAGDPIGAGLAVVHRISGLILDRGDLPELELELEAMLSVGESHSWVAERVRSVLGQIWFYSGSFDRDEANLQRMLADARAGREEYLQTIFLSGIGLSLAFQGRTAEARAAVEEAKAASTSWREAPVLEYEVQGLWLEGDLAAVLDRAEEILEWNPEGLSRRRAVGLAFAGLAAAETDELGRARRYVDLALAAYEDRTFASCFDSSLHADGLVSAREGRTALALERLERSAERLTRRGFRTTALLVLTDLAEVAATSGNGDLVRWAASTAASLAAGIDRACYPGLALIAAGWGSLVAGVHDEAAEHARDAAKILCRTGWRLFQGRAFDVAGRAQRFSDPAGAREAFETAVALFDACGATWRRDRAVSELEGLAR